VNKMETQESFDWFREDIKTMSGARRGKFVTFKGVALFPTVSRNQREYIENECMLSARTLANVPIDINHAYDVWLDKKNKYEQENPGISYESITPAPQLWGNVIDAEWEDGRIEYVAQAKGEYGEKIIDKEKLTREQYIAKWGKEPLYGVSISASYRYAADDDDMLTPLGIKFNRLSLVEDPEHPGVVGTTVELLETYNRQSIKEVEVVGNLLKIASPSLFESYRDEVIKPYKEGKPLENRKYVASPVVGLLDYGELHEKIENPLEEETETNEVKSEEEFVEEKKEKKPDEKPDDDSDEDKKKKAEEATVTEPMEQKRVEEIALEKLDFTAFNKKVELAKPTGDAEVDAKVAEVNQKRVEQATEKKDEAIKQSLTVLHENLVKLAKQQSTIVEASSEANQCVGKKVAETQKQVKSLLDRLEEKAGVDKVEKLRGIMESVKEKLDIHEKKLKETEGEFLPIVETLNSVVETVTGFTDLTDEIRTDLKQKDEHITSLKKALEVSEQNNAKLASKIGKLETEYETSTNTLKTTLTETGTKITETEKKLVTDTDIKLDAIRETINTGKEEVKQVEIKIREELKTSLNDLTEMLDKITKKLNEEDDAEKQKLKETIDNLAERLENIEETSKGEYKSDKEAEHTTEPTYSDDVFTKPTI